MTPLCLHRTPHYYLGWAIELDNLYKAYPDYHGGSFSNFWHARVVHPWNKKLGGVYVSERYVRAWFPFSNSFLLCYSFYSGLPLRPYYTNLFVDGRSYTVIYIASNYHAKDIDIWRDKEYIRFATEIAFTDEEHMGELQWIRV